MHLLIGLGLAYLGIVVCIAGGVAVLTLAGLAVTGVIRLLLLPIQLLLWLPVALCRWAGPREPIVIFGQPRMPSAPRTPKQRQRLWS